MILFFLMSCLVHKTTLTGVVDYVGDKSCAIVLNDLNTDIIVINSEACKGAKEGDTIIFYGRKESPRGLHEAR